MQTMHVLQFVICVWLELIEFPPIVKKSSPSWSGVANPKPFAGFQETVLAQELRLAEERQAVQLQELQVFQLRNGGKSFLRSLNPDIRCQVRSFKVNSIFFIFRGF